MLAANKIFHRYLWLLDTVYSAGVISRDEINRRWANSPYNYDHEDEYLARTFHRDREAIFELFGIEIVCNKHTNTYSIDGMGDLEAGGMRAWLIDTFAVHNMVNLSGSLRDRVLFEPIPEGSRYLSEIAAAMQDNRQLYVTYQGFNRPEPHSFLLAPYCLKVFQRRWYLVGKPDDHPEEREPRVYALDRVRDLAATDRPFALPKTFRAAEHFEGYFGVDRTEAYKPQIIRVRVTAAAANYLRTLPIHPSQTEVKREADFSEFAYLVAPTYDFRQELRKHGPNLVVLSPAALREDFARDVATLYRAYGGE